MRDQVKAPKRLVNAVIRGERVHPKHKADTTATHIRRFSKAFAVYACAAVLLIGGAFALPALLDNPAASQPQPDATVSDQTPDSAVLPEDFVRPDLVWADETNRLSEKVIFSWYEYHELQEQADNKAGIWINLPDYPDDTVYSVKAEVKNLDLFLAAIPDVPPSTPDWLITFLTEHEGWESFIGPDGELCFAVTKAQIEALDTATLFTIFADKLNPMTANTDGVIKTYAGGEFSLAIAWQSPTGTPPIKTEWAGQWNSIECHES